MSSRVKPLTQVEFEPRPPVATIRFTTEGDVNIFSSRVLGELGTCVDRLAREAAIRRLKHAMLHGDEVTQFGLSFSCSDGKEGMHAFLEKRPPSWSTWANCTSDG